MIPMKNEPNIASPYKLTPTAIPIANEKKIYIISWVSLTAVRNLIIDIAPTKPNALARLFPITIITIAVIITNKIRELTNEA
jgi:hypothetical protein